eukprot:Gregarina_sp_Poly_1__1230@NODE_12_length_23383_cov_104_521445_g10_i0_p15_GENE_NODE_12_length_23383_cov_104_521445_g10_i0NODE_12_length_23383_cov_104_521445_g10_i0_p15_ORF_typecomplete_len128_score23_06Bromo_TP/PF07524_13/1_5e03Bromo_TP/PF07524_13/0_5_NODE_12_length_23383_cov_104_521445_g10_i01347513858
MEHHLCFALPEAETRRQLFDQYLNKLALKITLRNQWWFKKLAVTRAKVQSEPEDLPKMCEVLTRATESWSGRAIARLCEAIEFRVLKLGSLKHLSDVVEDTLIKRHVSPGMHHAERLAVGTGVACGH